MLNSFLAGSCCIGFLVAALFFFKFWGRSHDRLFLAFALAFVLFGMDRILTIAVPGSSDNRPYIYLVRLAGFCIIISGIIGKNRQ